MRKFLLTWYGLTDFRASLGFEGTDGPIAGALAADSYSDVIILGYTRADNNPSECPEDQKAFSAELDSIHNSGHAKDWMTTGSFVSKFANTTVAHEYFLTWLQGKFISRDGSVSIHLKSEKLRELNDTEGIYACAIRALDWVAQQSGEKLVTLYLSPGTPVMAFVWAFAALGHPELKKRLIASPVIGKAPETISLPTEWLERHGAKKEAIQDIAKGFDVMFHLFGEQRMPALLGIRQFEADHHIFLNSKDYPADCMRIFLDGRSFYEIPVDPWDDRAIHEKITQIVKSFPARTRIAINLTGGTKLMFTGALAAARELGAVPVYFDSRNRRVTFVNSLYRETIRPIDSVEYFLLLNGDGLKLSNCGSMEDFSLERRSLTKAMWVHRNKISKSYQKLCELNKYFKPFHLCESGFEFVLEKDCSAKVKGYGLDLHFEKWPDFAKYLSGGWFEEYVYAQCKPYEEKGIIKDLRINVKLELDQAYSGGISERSSEHNELDITFTDGYSLYIVECKAGKVTQEQVMKLQNLVRFYGGVEGRGIVACCFPPSAESVRKKIDDARLKLWYGSAFPEQIRVLMDDIARRAQLIGESK